MVKSDGGVNYLKVEYNSGINPDGFGSGYILIDSVYVTCDNTEDYNPPYEWNATYPTTGKEVSATITSV